MSKYDSYKNSDLWRLIDETLLELEENTDIEVTTAREYVIGYLCEKLLTNFQLSNILQNEIPE